MKVTIRITVATDTHQTHEDLVLERTDLGPDTLGLSLAEAHTLLATVQQTMVCGQRAAAVAEQATCPDCGRPYRHKDHRTVKVRTLFGTLTLDSPRWQRCCQSTGSATFSPLAALLPERITPELRYLETRLAAVMSYAQAARLLAELYPLGRPLHPAAVREHVHHVATRLERELGPEQFSFITGCPADWAELPRPDLPLTMGIDGGYVHSAHQSSRRDGWFEVIAGKSIPTHGQAKCFAFVATHDTKPKRRLYEVLVSQGLQANQQLTVLTDGGEDIRDLPSYLTPLAEHYLDWFHLTMRITVATQQAKSLPRPPGGTDLAALAATELERVKWLLWHGNTFRALLLLDDLQVDLDTIDADPAQHKVATTLAEFAGYIRANLARIPNYGERRRCGEPISTGFVESAVNQIVSKRMVKKQQMRWTPAGAHLFLQIRTRVLNDDLANDFRRWYPGFTHQPQPDKIAA